MNPHFPLRSPDPESANARTFTRPANDYPEAGGIKQFSVLSLAYSETYRCYSARSKYCFVFGTTWVETLVLRLTVLNEVYCLWVNAMTMSHCLRLGNERQREHSLQYFID